MDQKIAELRCAIEQSDKSATALLALFAQTLDDLGYGKAIRQAGELPVDDVSEERAESLEAELNDANRLVDEKNEELGGLYDAVGAVVAQLVDEGVSQETILGAAKGTELDATVRRALGVR